MGKKHAEVKKRLGLREKLRTSDYWDHLTPLGPNSQSVSFLSIHIKAWILPNHPKNIIMIAATLMWANGLLLMLLGGLKKYLRNSPLGRNVLLVQDNSHSLLSRISVGAVHSKLHIILKNWEIVLRKQQKNIQWVNLNVCVWQHTKCPFLGIWVKWPFKKRLCELHKSEVGCTEYFNITLFKTNIWWIYRIIQRQRGKVEINLL